MQLQELAGKVWKKEDELKQLKSELSVLDRKIHLELAKNNSASENVKEDHIYNGISNKENFNPMLEKNSPVLSSSDELKVNSYKGIRL